MFYKIVEYEKRLSEDKQELNELICEYYEQKKSENESLDSEFAEHKINCLRQEIKHIDWELALLQKRISESVREKEKVSVSVEEEKVSEKDVRMIFKRNIETLVGRNLMGVFASVLIFISLIFFATLLYPYLNDTVKMLSMYAVSFLFLCIGMIRLKEDKKSTLYQSVTACGLGAVYISLLVSNLYFGVIGDVMLYVFIALWAGVICMLSVLRSVIFQIIGQLGICIAVIFGTGLCLSTDDTWKFLVLILFFIAASAVFVAAYYQKEYGKNCINHIFNLISTIVLSYGVCELILDEKIAGMQILALWILLIYILSNLLVSYLGFRLDEKRNLLFGFINVGYTVMAACLITQMGTEELFCNIVIMLLAVFLFVGNDWKFKNRKDEGKILYDIFLLLTTFVVCFMTEQMQTTVSLVIFIIPLLLLGFAKNYFQYKVYALFYLWLLLFNIEMEPWLHLIYGLMVVGAVTGLMVWKKEQYNYVIKNISYIFLHLYLFRNVIYIYLDLEKEIFGLETLCFLVFMIHSVLNMVAMKTVYSKNWYTGEKESASQFITNLINGICMILSVFCIELMENEWYHIICIFIAIALFLMNSENFFKKHENLFGGFYVGIKFTVLMVIIADSFEVSNYVITFLIFLAAIISIVTGFRFLYKSFRIYGLVLAIFDVIKLTLVDITYDNTIERAFSFFVCGILCFVISIIYHRLDKKFLQNEDKNELKLEK